MILGVVLSIVLPLLLSAVVMTAAWRPWRIPAAAPEGGAPDAPTPDASDGDAAASSGPSAPWAAALAIGLGWLVGLWRVEGLPEMPPVTGEGWIPWIVLAVTAFGVLDGLVSAPDWLRSELRIVGGALIAILVLHPIFYWEWDHPGIPLRIVALVAAATIVTWTGIDALGRALPTGPAYPLAMLITVCAAAGVLAMSGGAKFGQLFGVLAATIGPCILLALWRPSVSIGRSGSGVIATVFTGFLIAGAWFAEVKNGPAIALLLVPHAAWAGHIPWVARRKPWQTALIVGVAVAIPAAIAMGLAFAGLEPPPDPEEW